MNITKSQLKQMIESQLEVAFNEAQSNVLQRQIDLDAKKQRFGEELEKLKEDGYENVSFLKEQNEVIRTNSAVVIFSDWAKGHIERGHKKPGKGSVFADFDLSLINQALEQVELNPNQAVYTMSVPGVGYDLVLPNNEAEQLENVEQLEVEKEDRQGPIMVNAYSTSEPLENFKTDKLSVVIRPSSELQYIPEDLQQDETILNALEQGVLYSVLSAWPGRGDVPPANQWGDDWAVIIPS